MYSGKSCTVFLGNWNLEKCAIKKFHKKTDKDKFKRILFGEIEICNALPKHPNVMDLIGYR